MRLTDSSVNTESLTAHKESIELGMGTRHVHLKQNSYELTTK